MAIVSDIPRCKHEEQRVSDTELQVAPARKALGIDDFCRLFGVGRTTAYSEIKSGRLRARKVGKRTLISFEDADNWLQSLPLMEAKP